jgi:ATP-dependent Zn protease
LLESLAQPRSYSEDAAREIDAAIRALVDRAFESAVELLNKRRDALERGGQRCC